MTGESSPPGRPGSTDERGVTRRRALALAGVGAAGLAGCSSLPLGGGEEEVTLDGDDVAAVAEGSVPTVTEPLPVSVGDAHVAESRERATSFLEGVPLPLSADELPNGVMRRELAHSVEHAREGLTEAAEATAVPERLNALGDAREYARQVAASWAYANDELTPEDVRESARTVRDEAMAFRENWEYVGAEPVRALLVHDAVESWSGTARRAAEPVDPARRDGTNAITVGERAGEVEQGRACLGDARHVGEQFRASLAEPQSIRATLTDARAALGDAIESRQDDLPGPDVDDVDELADADRDLADTPAGEALRRLNWRIPYSPDPTDELADDVVLWYRGLAFTEGFAWLRDRVENGERFDVESVGGLRERRSAAVTAVSTAVDESDDRRLARQVLADYVPRISDADRDLRRYDGTVGARSLRYEVAEYVSVTALARGVPPAVEETLTALGAE